MWTSIATNLVAAATNHFLSKPENTENRNQGGYYNIRGHINNLPVDLEVERTSHSSGGSRFTQEQQSGRNVRSGSSSSGLLCLQNGNTSSSTNINKTKKQQGNYTKKPNHEKHCQIVIPTEGNYEINIRKFESGFAGMSMSDSKFQKGGSNNTFRQNGQQNKVNGNQNKPFGNQNKSYSNQNKLYGNQNKPNKSGNQNVVVKSQNERQMKYQNRALQQCNDQVKTKKEENVKHRKPGELKLNKNNFGRKNIGASINQDRNLNSSCQGTWMYLGRLTVGTTEVAVQNYLQQKFPGNNFVVQTLPLYKDAKLPCFKVKVDDRIFEEFRKPLASWGEDNQVYRKF